MANLSEQKFEWGSLSYQPSITLPTFDTCTYELFAPQGLYSDDSKLSITFTKLDNIDAYIHSGNSVNDAKNIVTSGGVAAGTPVIDTAYTVTYSDEKPMFITVIPKVD